jgi:hypothetical protein
VRLIRHTKAYRATAVIRSIAVTPVLKWAVVLIAPPPVAIYGTVTLIADLQTKGHGRNDSHCDCRSAPCQHSLIAKHAQGSAGGQMALEVEHIVDGGVD